MGEGDYNFVLRGGPWIHKGDALIVVPYDGKTRPSEVDLDVIPIWVQVYDLPGVMLNKDMGKALGEKLGKFIEVHLDDGDIAAGKFMRIKVALPLNKPLKPWLELKLNGKICQFKLKYEKVPHFCFRCGRMGHAGGECQFRRHGFSGFCYDEDLRVSPYKRMESRSRTIHAMEKPIDARGLQFSNPLQQFGINQKAKKPFVQESTMEEGKAVAPDVANVLAAGFGKLRMHNNASVQSRQRKIMDQLPETSVESSGSFSGVRTATKSCDATSSARSIDSDKKWKHVSVMHGAIIPVQRAFQSIHKALDIVGSIQGVSQDILMLPASQLGKRNSTESDNGSGREVNVEELEEREVGVQKKGRTDNSNDNLTGAHVEPR
ncbi:hypothetical protein EJB05_26783, partial [Eragrostis curvula]